MLLCGSKAKLTVTCGELYLNINHSCSHFSQPWQHPRMRHQNPFSPNWRTTQLLRRPTKRHKLAKKRTILNIPRPTRFQLACNKGTRQVGWRFWFSITDLWLFIHYNCGNKQMEGCPFFEGGACFCLLRASKAKFSDGELTNTLTHCSWIFWLESP